MATAVNYQLIGNSARMDKGRVQEIRATVQVTGLTATDYQWVDQVLAATNMPSYGQTLVLATGERLYLTKIDPQLRDGEKSTADIGLTYELRDGSSSDNNGSVPILTGGTSLKQVETAYDRNGAPIEVSHAWPDDSKATYPDGSLKRGTTETATAKIPAFVPMSAVRGEFILQTATPGAITQAYVGHVNSVFWQNGEPRTWMCTEGTFELLDNTSSPPLYTIGLGFEYDDQTWDNDTTAFFIDPQTGSLPVIDPNDLPLPNGKEVVQVQYYPEKDFNGDF